MKIALPKYTDIGMSLYMITDEKIKHIKCSCKTPHITIEGVSYTCDICHGDGELHISPGFEIKRVRLKALDNFEHSPVYYPENEGISIPLFYYSVTDKKDTFSVPELLVYPNKKEAQTVMEHITAILEEEKKVERARFSVECYLFDIYRFSHI